MGRAKPVVIDTRRFASQKDAKAFFKEMLNQYQPRDRVTEAHAVELRALLKRHTEYDDKVRGGIDHFVVDIAPEYSTKCFQIVRPDGSKIDFSYGHCIDRIPR